MNKNLSFGVAVKERRNALGLTQRELARRVGCAEITIRKIEADAYRPSRQIVERLALALNVSEEEQLAFVQLARQEPPPSPLPTPSPSPEEIGLEDLSGRSVHGFELSEKIGSGGFGVVYRAFQPTVKREVAVKIILPVYANNPNFIRRFEAEAQIVAHLEHPHIVPLYDYWREPNAAYLIMRLLRGGSLQDLLPDGPMPLAVVNKYLQQFGQGLAVAHRNGIIHRDIKPANVLLDEDGNAYLADFGIAKQPDWMIEGDKTEAGVIVGSPAYISPEQILSEPVKAQSDIYSLGVMLYEMLTGHKPFPGPTPVLYIQQHLNDVAPPISQFDGLPVELDTVFTRATARDTENRYADVLDLLSDFGVIVQSAAGNGHKVALPAVAPAPIPSTTEISQLENPFKGLRSFTEADSENFYGRDTLIQDLLERMGERSDLSRFLAVVGPSGSGKSSVVKAGLIPALRRGALEQSDEWFIVEMMPGSQPFEELEAALLRVAVNPPESLFRQLQEDDRGLHRALLRVLPADETTELVLLIDQFEEVFTLVEDEAVRTSFLAALVTAVLDPRSRLRLIITLRADFTDRPLQYVDFGEFLRQRSEFVLPLTPDELEQVIVQPVEKLGMQLEPKLLATIIHDVGDQPGILPLLQYTMTELFEERQGATLTLQAYQESGGVAGSLARRADEIYEGLDGNGRHAARQLFLRLITLGEGVEDTRRRVRLAELEGLAIDGNPNTEYRLPITEYGNYRLLTFDNDPTTREPTVEVAHEALLREWQRLRTWLDESRTDVRLQRMLAGFTAEWLAADEEDGFLLREARLDQFDGWQETTTLALTADEQTYLNASMQARQRRAAQEEERRQRELETARQLAEEQSQRAEVESRSARRLRWLAAGLALLVLVAIGAAWLAVVRGQEAQANYIESERIRLATQAQNTLARGEDSELSMLLALRSLQLNYSTEADAALQAAVALGAPVQTYVGHTADIQQITFSADGKYLVTASSDGTVRLWDVQSGEELRQFTGHAGPVFLVELSPNGNYLLTSGNDGTNRLWDVNSGEDLYQFPGTFLASGIAFTSDSRRFAVAKPGIMAVHDVLSGDILYQFDIPEMSGSMIDFSPDDQLIALSFIEKEGGLTVWDIDTGEEVQQFVGHEGWIGWVDFSPDGRYILSTGQDGTARIWDVETGEELRRFEGHTDALFNGFFAPDGQTVITGSYDKTARVWDVMRGVELQQIRGHTDFISVAYAPDGRHIATAGGDHVAKLWDINSDIEPKIRADFSKDHFQDQSAFSLSPDRQTILLGRVSGVVQLLDAQSGHVQQEIKTSNNQVKAQALSPNNQLLVVGDSDGLVSLWDAVSGETVWTFAGHSGAIRDVAFLGNGRFVLTASEDGTARLISVASGEEVEQYTGHDGAVLSITPSADGTQLLTGGADGAARLWETDSGEELRQFSGHSGPVFATVFSADGTMILTGGADQSARVWQVEDGQQIQELIGHTEAVIQVAFSPDGQYFLTGSEDQTARLWDSTTGEEIHQYGGHISPIFLAEFSEDGRHIFTADSKAAYEWLTTLDDLVALTCSQLSRDFSEQERRFYNISDNNPTCPNNAMTAVAAAKATWTPVAATPAPAPIALDFMVMEAANVQMGMPVQHVYVSANDDTIVRPVDLNPETLKLPLFRSTEYISDTLEAPYDLGPFPKGDPLGFTLAEWTAASGHGTYTQIGDRALVDLQFEGLVPNGVYTLWCVTLQFVPTFAVLEELPCGESDGSTNNIAVDENGQGTITVEIDAFPLSTEAATYELAVAYHSDGKTYGAHPGEYGKNLHAHLLYDFLPPGY